MAPVELDQPEPSETAQRSAEPPPFASRAVMWSGVAGACALGVAAGLWARPGLAERGLAEPPPEKPAAEAAEPRLQIIVDDTPAPIGAPIEVLPALPEPAPYTPPPRQIVAEPAPRQPPSGLMRAGGVAEPEAAPAEEPLEPPRRALRLPHFDFGGTFGKLKRLVSNTEAQEAEAEQTRADAEARLTEQQRIAAERRKAGAARQAAAKAEQARLAEERLAQEKKLAETKAAELKATERAEARREAALEAEREAEADRRRAEVRQAKLDAEAAARRKAERLEKAELAKAEDARAEKAKLAKAEALRAEKARAARLEKVKAQKAEAARVEKAKLAKAEKARAEKARIEKAKLEKDRKEAERLRIAKAEKAAEKARAEKIRLAAVKAEKLKAEKAKAAQVRLAANTKPAPKKNRCALPDIGEALVCADPALSAADRRMVRAYREAQAAGVPEWQLQEQQNRWRAARTAAAREAPWQVREVYLARIAELNDMAASGGAN